MMNEAVEVKKQSLVDEALELLSTSLDMAAEGSFALVKRLEPVMRPLTPQPDSADQADGVAKLADEPSPVVVQIRQLRSRVESVRSEMKSALQRLQV